MKKSIVTIVAFMLFALAGFAQEKYEYATLRKTTFAITLKTEKGTEVLPIEKGDDKEAFTLKKLADLNAQGWEVYFVTETTETGSALSYHLRKKKS